MSEDKFYMQTSIPSIQQFPLQQKPYMFHEKQQYVKNLQQYIEYQKTAIQTAENLINNYRIQNLQLSQQKLKIQDSLKTAQRKIQVLQIAILNSNYNRGNLLELSNQVTILLEKQSHYENKIQEMSTRINELEQTIDQPAKNKQTLNASDKLKELRISFFNRDNFTNIMKNRQPIAVNTDQRVKFKKKQGFQVAKSKTRQMINKSYITQVQQQVDHNLFNKDYYSLRSKTIASTSLEMQRHSKGQKRLNKGTKYGCITSNKSGKSQGLIRKI